NKYLTDSIKSNILYKTYPFVVSVTIIILASRISIIALVILFIIYIFFILKLKQALFATLLICLLSIFLFWKVDFLNARFTKAINMLKQDKNAVNNYTVDDRIMIWSNAIELIKEEPIKGYNIGDARNHFLREKHNTSGFGKGYREHYNCHNQFLESWLSLGILGVITMILIFATLLYIGIIEKNKVIIGFTLLLFIFSLVESILESQGGIMFFAFFVGLFLNKLKHV
ncbi:MAG: O-antigen ligase family protein, partial [Bacteroidetes bacterium]|nr:O-antigen ligase family protein [Bacteroidota bacterium]